MATISCGIYLASRTPASETFPQRYRWDDPPGPTRRSCRNAAAESRRWAAQDLVRRALVQIDAKRSRRRCRENSFTSSIAPTISRSARADPGQEMLSASTTRCCRQAIDEPHSKLPSSPAIAYSGLEGEIPSSMRLRENCDGPKSRQRRSARKDWCAHCAISRIRSAPFYAGCCWSARHRSATVSATRFLDHCRCFARDPMIGAFVQRAPPPWLYLLAGRGSRSSRYHFV